MLCAFPALVTAFAQQGAVPLSVDRTNWHLPTGSTFCLKYPQACKGPAPKVDICTYRPRICDGTFTEEDMFNASKNRLVGTIPSEIGNNVNYEGIIDLRGNSLSGTIPSTIGKLTKVRGLFLNVNSFSGTIPSELARLHQASGIKLHDNHLSGTIPSEFGQLDNLYCQNSCGYRDGFDLHWNYLTGTIPQHLSHFVHIACSLVTYQTFGNDACPTPRTAFTNTTFSSQNYPTSPYQAGWVG